MQGLGFRVSGVRCRVLGLSFGVRGDTWSLVMSATSWGSIFIQRSAGVTTHIRVNIRQSMPYSGTCKTVKTIFWHT